MMNKIMIKILWLSVFCVSPGIFADEEEDTPDFVGSISAITLHQNYRQFSREYEHYKVVANDVRLVKAISRPIVITALFGTWCHDSIREIPRLYKLLEMANNPKISLTLIAVDRQKSADKSYRLNYTPTIIIYQAQQELGRIVERPNKGLAQDISSILTRP